MVSRHKNEVATQNLVNGRTTWLQQENEVAKPNSTREEKSRSRDGIEVTTRNPVKGKTVRSRQESVVATHILGDRRKLSRQGPNWLTTKTVLRPRNFVATHNSAKEERARSQHGIMVATQIYGNKKMWSQQESSPLETQHGHDATIPIVTVT